MPTIRKWLFWVMLAGTLLSRDRGDNWGVYLKGPEFNS